MTDSWEEQREGEVAFSWSKGGKLNELPRMPKGLDVKPRAYESQYLPHSGTRLEPETMDTTSHEQPEAAAYIAFPAHAPIPAMPGDCGNVNESASRSDAAATPAWTSQQLRTDTTERAHYSPYGSLPQYPATVSGNAFGSSHQRAGRDAGVMSVSHLLQGDDEGV